MARPLTNEEALLSPLNAEAFRLYAKTPCKDLPASLRLTIEQARNGLYMQAGVEMFSVVLAWVVDGGRRPLNLQDVIDIRDEHREEWKTL